MQEQGDIRAACKMTVELLALGRARLRGRTRRGDRADLQAPARLADLRARFRPEETAVPEVAVELAPLSVYDELVAVAALANDSTGAAA